MSDEQRAQEQHDIGTKVHGDKLEHLIPRDDTGGSRVDEARGTGHDQSSLVPHSAINRDHPDRTSEPGTGGLMPGSYEQAGGEGGHRAGERGAAAEDDVIRAPGSRVPDPGADPRQRAAALDIARGTGHP